MTATAWIKRVLSGYANVPDAHMLAAGPADWRDEPAGAWDREDAPVLYALPEGCTVEGGIIRDGRGRACDLHETEDGELVLICGWRPEDTSAPLRAVEGARP